MIHKEKLGWSIFGTYYRVGRWQLATILYAVDRIGMMLFSLRNRKPPKHPGSILVIQLDHAGDMIMSSSLIRNIRSQYPEATISVLIRSLADPIAKLIDGVDDIIHLHTPWLSREHHVGWIGV